MQVKSIRSSAAFSSKHMWQTKGTHRQIITKANGARRVSKLSGLTTMGPNKRKNVYWVGMQMYCSVQRLRFFPLVQTALTTTLLPQDRPPLFSLYLDWESAIVATVGSCNLVYLQHKSCFNFFSSRHKHPSIGVHQQTRTFFLVCAPGLSYQKFCRGEKLQTQLFSCKKKKI